MNRREIARLHASHADRRNAAIRAFWSDDPLNLTARREIGETFSLRRFIAFVLELPQEQFESCTKP